MLIIQESDFELGFYRIPTTQYTKGVLTDAIQEHEYACLVCLLGKELADELIADLLDGVPNTQKYLDLFDPWTKEIYHQKRQSLGIRKYLLGCIYYEVMINRNYVVTEGGNVSNRKENSALLEFHNNSRVAEVRFNTSKFTADSIQYFASSQYDTYPNYEGEKITPKYNALL